MVETHDTSVLQNVTSAAVWGSLAASFCLGSFFIIQCFAYRSNRARFGTFAAINLLIGLNDLCHPYLSFYDYERIRIVLWSAYVGCLLWVLSIPTALVIGAPIALVSAATFVWLAWKPELGTSFVVGPMAYIAAFAHGTDFRRRHCYASCVLCGCSLALGMLSSFYYFFVATGDQALIVTGYAHYAALSLLALIFGWVHFPRELSGRAPIRVNSVLAIGYVATMFLGQALVLVSLLVLRPWSLAGYLVGALIIVGATLLLFFQHRHQLVIYTENVTVLLNERTASLVKAREELAMQNQRQAELLAEQEKEITSKNEVIERQRRLELAAQTAGQAAHDIRNLLAPIVVQLEILQRRFENHSGQEVIAVMKRQCNRLRELTDQLLALSRRGQLQHYPVLLNELLRDVSLDTAGVPIRIEWEGEAWVMGCASQLIRAVANLLTNALDATNFKPLSVTLSCGEKAIASEQRCHMGFLKPGRYSFIRVMDEGGGIPAVIIDRVFEPFFSSKTASPSAGSGLGLSIVAAVVDDHDGVLDIETSAAGTNFTIFLPRIDAPPLSQKAVRPVRSVPILLIDDDYAVPAKYGDALRRHGFDVSFAATIKEAATYFESRLPELVVLDMHLPDGSGAEILDYLSRHRAANRALVFSNYLTSEECLRLSSLGAQRFAYKPLGPNALITAIEEALADVRNVVVESRDVSNA